MIIMMRPYIVTLKKINPKIPGRRIINVEVLANNLWEAKKKILLKGIDPDYVVKQVRLKQRRRR